MLFIYSFVFALLFMGLFAIAELVVENRPNAKFSKWWRKYVVYECQECD